jgi:hypothetical protein
MANCCMPLPVLPDDTFIVTDPEAIAVLKTLVPPRLGRWASSQRRQELINHAARFALGLDGDMTIAQAARHLKCHQNTVNNLRKDGRFPGLYYRSPNKILIPFKDLMSLPDRYRARITNDDGSRIKQRTNAFSDDPLPSVKPTKAKGAKKSSPAPETSKPPRRRYLTMARKLALAEERAAVTTVGVISQEIVPQAPSHEAVTINNDTTAVPPPLEAGQ